MSRLFYVAEFKVEGDDDGEYDHYVAAGWDIELLPVYKLSGERSVQLTPMFYPSCLKFMIDAVVSEEDPRTMTSKEWGRKYDVVDKRVT